MPCRSANSLLAASMLSSLSQNPGLCFLHRCKYRPPGPGRPLQAQSGLSTAPLQCRPQPARACLLARAPSQERVPTSSKPPLVWKDHLSPEQLAAVETTDGCIRVVAGPGSGKTRVLVQRVVHLISNCGVHPREILFITFTNKAAQEIRERIGQYFDFEVASDMTVCTFHSLCAKILRWKPCSGVSKKFTIYDERDSEMVMKRILKEAENAFKAADSCGFQVEQSSELFQDLKNLGFLTNNSPENKILKRCLASGEKFIANSQDKTLAAIKKLSKAIKMSRLYKVKCSLAKPGKSDPENLSPAVATLYENALRRNNALDFDDLIQLVVELLHSHDDIREELQKRWRYILVDEFQDTDMVQYELIRLLASKHPQLFVVGDIDQAIYGWRGAELRHMQQSLSNDFPAIRTFHMSTNFRSSSYIVKAASAILSFSRYDRSIGPSGSLSLVSAVKGEKAAPICIGEFGDQASEANFIVSEISKLVRKENRSWGSFAILYRTRIQALQFGLALAKANVPHYILGATQFYADKEMKLLLAYLKYISNANDCAALDYCLNKPSRGIGDKTLKKLGEWASNRKLSIPQALENIHMESVTCKELGIQPKAREGIVGFVKLILDLREMTSKKPVIHLIRRLIKRLDFDEYLWKVSQNEEQYRRHNERLELLLAAAQNIEGLYGLGEEALSRFLEDIALLANNEETPGSDPAASRNGVKLLTIHGSKGLEFDIVFIVGASDNLLPLEDGDDDEERRLFYVGITRARKQLYLTCNPGQSLPWADRSYKISRFVEEIVDSLPSQCIKKLSVFAM